MGNKIQDNLDGVNLGKKTSFEVMRYVMHQPMSCIGAFPSSYKYHWLPIISAIRGIKNPHRR